MEDPCAICLDAIRDSEMCTLPCNHNFHKDCINEWSKVHRGGDVSCPNCRSTVDQDVVQEIQKPLGIADILLLPVIAVILLGQSIPYLFTYLKDTAFSSGPALRHVLTYLWQALSHINVPLEALGKYLVIWTRTISNYLVSSSFAIYEGIKPLGRTLQSLSVSAGRALYNGCAKVFYHVSACAVLSYQYTILTTRNLWNATATTYQFLRGYTLIVSSWVVLFAQKISTTVQYYFQALTTLIKLCLFKMLDKASRFAGSIYQPLKEKLTDIACLLLRSALAVYGWLRSKCSAACRYMGDGIIAGCRYCNRMLLRVVHVIKGIALRVLQALREFGERLVGNLWRALHFLLNNLKNLSSWVGRRSYAVVVVVADVVSRVAYEIGLKGVNLLESVGNILAWLGLKTFLGVRWLAITVQDVGEQISRKAFLASSFLIGRASAGARWTWQRCLSFSAFLTRHITSGAKWVRTKYFITTSRLQGMAYWIGTKGLLAATFVGRTATDLTDWVGRKGRTAATFVWGTAAGLTRWVGTKGHIAATFVGRNVSQLTLWTVAHLTRMLHSLKALIGSVLQWLYQTCSFLLARLLLVTTLIGRKTYYYSLVTLRCLDSTGRWCLAKAHRASSYLSSHLTLMYSFSKTQFMRFWTFVVCHTLLLLRWLKATALSVASTSSVAASSLKKHISSSLSYLKGLSLVVGEWSMSHIVLPLLRIGKACQSSTYQATVVLLGILQQVASFIKTKVITLCSLLLWVFSKILHHSLTLLKQVYDILSLLCHSIQCKSIQLYQKVAPVIYGAAAYCSASALSVAKTTQLHVTYAFQKLYNAIAISVSYMFNVLHQALTYSLRIIWNYASLLMYHSGRLLFLLVGAAIKAVYWIFNNLIWRPLYFLLSSVVAFYKVFWVWFKSPSTFMVIVTRKLKAFSASVTDTVKVVTGGVIQLSRNIFNRVKASVIDPMRLLLVSSWVSVRAVIQSVSARLMQLVWPIYLQFSLIARSGWVRLSRWWGRCYWLVSDLVRRSYGRVRAVSGYLLGRMKEMGQTVLNGARAQWGYFRMRLIGAMERLLRATAARWEGMKARFGGMRERLRVRVSRLKEKVVWLIEKTRLLVSEWKGRMGRLSGVMRGRMEKLRERLVRLKGRMQERMGRMREEMVRLRGRMQERMNRMRERMNRLRERMQGRMDRMRERMNRLRERMQERMNRMTERMNRLRERMQERMNRMRVKVVQMRDRANASYAKLVARMRVLLLYYQERYQLMVQKGRLSAQRLKVRMARN